MEFPHLLKVSRCPRYSRSENVRFFSGWRWLLESLSSNWEEMKFLLFVTTFREQKLQTVRWTEYSSFGSKLKLKSFSLMTGVSSTYLCVLSTTYIIFLSINVLNQKILQRLSTISVQRYLLLILVAVDPSHCRDFIEPLGRCKVKYLLLASSFTTQNFYNLLH